MKIDRSWYVKLKDKKFPSAVSCGGVVIQKSRNGIKIAMVRDDKFEDKYYVLPKGRQEIGEGLLDAAEREIAEETGLSELNCICELGFKERLTFEKDVWKKMYYFLFTTKRKEGKQKLEKGEEGYVVEWFDIENLPPLFWPEQRELIEENRVKIKNLLFT